MINFSGGGTCAIAPIARSTRFTFSSRPTTIT
jgi:hypothetical protein